MSRETRDMIREASLAHCDLNILYGVIALLEGGTISSDRHVAVQRIIKICKTESARCLVRYDRTVAQIEGMVQ